MASLSSEESSFEDTDDISWQTELEIALLGNADFSELRALSNFRPIPARLRRDFWRRCLHREASSTDILDFTDVFDLPLQDELHESCKTAAYVLISQIKANDEVNVEPSLYGPPPAFESLTSDFESVLTCFSKTYCLPFIPENGWVAIIGTLYRVLRPMSRIDLFTYFISVYHRFVASGPDGCLRACNVFRLLLQYHDPELCNFLDSHKLGPEVYVKPWFESLFSGHVSDDTVLALWDIYFILAEPHFGMFITLILLINAKNSLMSITPEKPDEEEQTETEAAKQEGQLVACVKKSRRDLFAELKNLPKPMQPADLVNLVEIAQAYSQSTPTSFNTHYLPLLFGSPNPENADEGSVRLLTGALCLMVSVEEILNTQALCLKSHSPGDRGETFMPPNRTSNVRFLLVDCRPAEQYNAGHLATAFYLDTEIMLSNPHEFNTVARALLQSQQRGIASGSKAAGEHIVFLGSGRQAEDRLANMVVAHFLRLNTPYVSLVEGGYSALHEALGPMEFNNQIVNHETDLCFVCASTESLHMTALAKHADPQSLCFKSTASRSQSQVLVSSRMFSRISGLLKRNSGQSVVPSEASAAVNSATNAQTLRTEISSQVHSQPQKLRSSSYRNTAAVFSIYDNEDEEDDDEEEELNPELALRSRLLQSVLKPMQDSRLHDVNTSLEHCSPGDIRDFATCRTAPEVRAAFDCRLLDAAKQPSDNGLLLLLAEHFVIVQEKRPAFAQAVSSLMKNALLTATSVGAANKTGSAGLLSKPGAPRGCVLTVIPLSAIVRITSNRRIPEVITFFYSRTEDLLSETHQFVRVFIPKAGDAVKAVKMAVFCANGAVGDSSL